MTVIRPNSVSGITSITAQANEINFFRSNGTLAGLQLNGVNFNTTTGISTLAALKITGNLDVAGVLTYQDVTNVDSIGIITARSGINLTGGVINSAGNINCTSGRFQRGSSTVQDGDAIAGGININGTDMDASVIMSVFGNDSDFTRISGSKSRNASVGSHTIVQNNDVLLSLKGFGSDGTNFEEAAQIEMQVDGTPNNNVMPGRIVFKTATTDGVTEKLRITSAGAVGVGVTNPSSQLDVRTDDDPTDGLIGFIRNNTSGGNGAFYGMDVNGVGSFSFGMPDNTNAFTIVDGLGNSGDERLRITSNGDVRIGSGNPVTFGSGTTVHETYNANTYVANLVTSGTHQLQMIASQTHGVTSIGTRSNHQLNLCVNDSTKASITTDGKFGVGITNHTHLIEAYGVDSSIAVHHTGNSRGGLCAMTSQRLALATTVVNDDLVFGYSGNPLSSGSFVERMKIDNGTGDVLPGADNAQDLGSSSKRWANIYSADLQLSNIGTGGNEVDGSEGSWTLQEAEDTVYMINRKNGKRYKIKMEEV